MCCGTTRLRSSIFHHSCFVSSIKGLQLVFCYTTLCCGMINTWTLYHVTNEQWKEGLHRLVTLLLIFWITYSITGSCFNCSLLFLHWDNSKARVRESEWWLIVTQWVGKQKAFFVSYPSTPTQWPQLRWTHPGSLFPLCCSYLKKMAAYQEDINSHYISSMQLQSVMINVSPVTLLSVL